MSPDERGLVISNLGDMHFNSRPAFAQTMTQALHIEVKPRQCFSYVSPSVEGSGSGCLPKLALLFLISNHPGISWRGKGPGWA